MPGDACQEESCGDGKLGGHCPCVQLVEGACSRHHLDLSVTACYTMPGMHERADWSRTIVQLVGVWFAEQPGHGGGIRCQLLP